MADFDGTMRGLRSRAQQAIGDNARALAPYGHGPRAKAPTPPEKQWWNASAKLRKARQIADEMDEFPGHNDAGDAFRHAELSRRLATEIDPVTSVVAGVTHEWPTLVGRQPLQEALMDLKNNSEGLQAAAGGRAVDRSRLQNRPVTAPAVYSQQRQHYEDTSPNRGSYPAGPYSQGTVAQGYKDAPRYDPEERYPARTYK